MLEADPMSHMGDIGRTSPHRGDPVMSPDLGGGQGPGGAGRGASGPKSSKSVTKPAVKVEPKLEPGARPKIERQPGETPRQAVDRARKELELKPEPAAVKPTPDRLGRKEPSLKDIGKLEPGKRAPLPPSEKPIPHKKKAAAAAAAGLGALWLLNRDDEKAPTNTSVEPADDWGKQGSSAPDYETEKSEPSGQIGGAGNEVPQGSKQDKPVAPKISPDKSSPSASSNQPSPAPGKSDTPGVSTSGSSGKGGTVDDGEYDYATRMTTVRESMTTILTRHPVTGQMYIIKNQKPILESANQTQQQYSCGVARKELTESWTCNLWSETPISKLIKG